MTQYHPAVPNVKHVLSKNWRLIQNQPSVRQIFKEPPPISFSKGKFPKRHARTSKALKRSKTENTVPKSQPLRSCIGLSIFPSSYCAYSDPFPTGLLKCPYSSWLGQGNRLKCTNPPPHREKQRPKCTNPPPLW